jgi:hypothetical protein
VSFAPPRGSDSRKLTLVRLVAEGLVITSEKTVAGIFDEVLSYNLNGE